MTPLDMFLEDAAQAVSGVDQANLAIMRMKGDSMVGVLKPGDRFVVNLADQTPSPPGLFLIDSGVGLEARRVEYVPHSSPPVVRLHYANKVYPSSELPLERVQIVGRIIGAWQRV